MSIYNTSRTIKGRNTTARPSPVNRLGRPGVGPQRVLQQHQLQQQQLQQQQQQLQDNSYNEFALFSTAQRGKNHVMDFKSSKRVEPKEFARPIKLHRKETNFVPYRQYIQNLNAQNAAAAAANAQQTDKNPGSQVEDLSANSDAPAQQQQQQQQHGPRTGADISLIAPMGGATHNKKMLFKKRTKQIYMAKEDTRELKEQEHRPWILEDYDGQNSFTGTYEGGQRSDYMFFVLTDHGFQVMPVERWYKFQPKRNVKTLSLEEAEEQIKKQQKRENNRWMMLKRERDATEEDEEGGKGEGAGRAQRRLKLVDTEERRAGSDDENRQDSDIDDLDFDDVFQDDEEDQGEHEVEDEDVKDSKDRVKKEIKDFAITGREQDEEMDEDMIKLTSEGKQMRKLVRDLEKNRAYESDEEEADPYASSAEELETDQEEEESQSEAEKEKKPTPIPPKKKATLLNKAVKKAKKEGLSKPIGRPGSPSIKKEVKPSSPLAPQRPNDSPPPPSSPTNQKKRRSDDIVEAKPRKSEEEDLITEKEVIDTLRGKTMTTKDFLYNFRKRIRRNNRNREIITQLLKKVARSSKGSTDPNTRMLELKPEFQQ
ncbi:Transcription initiation factor IIF subunit alpha [Choanephora cucurbitarum]|uniref:Transcription initiation factor IIF subunit alpha n=1 Tax=Choanephora cucurbitarum TaxID=101091 RepID=A0A1C7NAV1_9FUNG|nr:Transcription initiation factor IIF subunit alpha [Choanephora cucurbitarum]